ITKKMLNENIDINTISRLTGLTKEEIESLR
ncbi:MAG: transposase, partial [Bacilli bacterium]|nr:transposase [Bacilli bacterium]